MIDIQELILEVDQIDRDFQALLDKHVEAIDELGGSITAQTKEKNELNGQIKAMKAKVELLRDSLMAILNAIGVDQALTSSGRTVRKVVTGVAPVIIRDGVEPSDVPRRYQRVTIDFDLVKIRKDLEAGHVAPTKFAELGDREPAIQIV